MYRRKLSRRVASLLKCIALNRASSSKNSSNVTSQRLLFVCSWDMSSWLQVTIFPAEEILRGERAGDMRLCIIIIRIMSFHTMGLSPTSKSTSSSSWPMVLCRLIPSPIVAALRIAPAGGEPPRLPGVPGRDVANPVPIAILYAATASALCFAKAPPPEPTHDPPTGLGCAAFFPLDGTLPPAGGGEGGGVVVSSHVLRTKRTPPSPAGTSDMSTCAKKAPTLALSSALGFLGTPASPAAAPASLTMFMTERIPVPAAPRRESPPARAPTAAHPPGPPNLPVAK
mmetsp:Transcript_33058/g.105326  ORF Transcript_33058/g.105326 Transcript_33058/m.105326 type:complete len:284 (-) Transcript_33058:42-893(-)